MVMLFFGLDRFFGSDAQGSTGFGGCGQKSHHIAFGVGNSSDQDMYRPVFLAAEGFGGEFDHSGWCASVSCPRPEIFGDLVQFDRPGVIQDHLERTGMLQFLDRRQEFCQCRGEGCGVTCNCSLAPYQAIPEDFALLERIHRLAWSGDSEVLETGARQGLGIRKGDAEKGVSSGEDRLALCGCGACRACDDDCFTTIDVAQLIEEPLREGVWFGCRPQAIKVPFAGEDSWMSC